MLGTIPDWLKPTPFVTPSSQPSGQTESNLQLEVKSPKAATTKAGIFDIFPALSYEDDNSSDDEASDDGGIYSKEEISKTLKDFRSRFSRLKLKWSQAFRDIESSHLLVTSDIAKIVTASKDLAAKVGSPCAIEGGSLQNLWQAFVHFSNKLQTNLSQSHEAIANLSNKNADLHLTLDEVQDAQTTSCCIV